MEYNDPVEYEKKDPTQVGLHNVELARSESDDLKETKEHLFDGNYDPAAVIREPSMLDEDIEEDSPYPEVRAAVSNMDDHTMHVNTWRVWFLGMFWTIIMAGVNQVSNLSQWDREHALTVTSALVSSSSSDTPTLSFQLLSPNCCLSLWVNSLLELCPTSGDSTQDPSTSRNTVSFMSVAYCYSGLADLT
jgi:hypothetical protein